MNNEEQLDEGQEGTEEGQEEIQDESGLTDFQKQIEQQFAELKGAIEAPKKEAQQQQQVEDKIKEVSDKTGFTKEQVEFLVQSVQQAVDTKVAPAMQSTGVQAAAEVVNGVDPSLIETVKQRMSEQPAELQANPSVWKSMANMVIGENYQKLSSSGKKAPQRTITGGSPLEAPGGSGGQVSSVPQKQYTAEEQADRQTLANQYFGGSLEAMDKYNSQGKTINQSGIKHPEHGNAADKALRDLMGNNG